MPAIPERGYSAACAHLASHLGISLAAARRRVDIRAAREELRDVSARQALAERMLEEAIASGVNHGTLLSSQLGAVGKDEFFMTDD
jgi:hypothetical protein